MPLVTSIPKIDLWFAFIGLPMLGVAMISYIIEIIAKNSDWQNELVKVIKLETIEQMSTAISHDIRNPLTTAIGYVDLMENNPLSTDKRNEYLLRLKEELDSAERVTKDFLTFSKPSLDFQKVLDLLGIRANFKSIRAFYKLSFHQSYYRTT